MRPILTILSTLFLCVALVLPAVAQDPPYKQGMPSEMKNSTLAPHTPSLIAKPGKEIPVDKIKLPPGFKAELWAEGLPNARSLLRVSL